MLANKDVIIIDDSPRSKQFKVKEYDVYYSVDKRGLWVWSCNAVSEDGRWSCCLNKCDGGFPTCSHQYAAYLLMQENGCAVNGRLLEKDMGLIEDNDGKE